MVKSFIREAGGRAGGQAGRQGGRQADTHRQTGGQAGGRARVFHPIAAGLLSPAAAEQSSAWLVDQTGPGAGLHCAVRNLGCSRHAGPQRRVKQVQQGWVGGVRRPGTCAGSGQECPVPGIAAAREEIQYSDLWHTCTWYSQSYGLNPLFHFSVSLYGVGSLEQRRVALVPGLLGQA